MSVSAVSLAALTRPELVFTDLPGGSREQVLEDLAHRIAAAGAVRDAGELFRQLAERERLGSTGVGVGVAIPHCKLVGLRSGVLAVGRTREGVDFGAADGQSVRVFFVVISPRDAPAEHLQILAALSRWIKSESHVSALLRAADAAEIHRLLEEES
jgi:mannitol/fructose-specific phosphotransferase system IIA component (Ntr-type)